MRKPSLFLILAALLIVPLFPFQSVWASGNVCAQFMAVVQSLVGYDVSVEVVIIDIGSTPPNLLDEHVTIPAGQTVTIIRRAQVSSPANSSAVLIYTGGTVNPTLSPLTGCTSSSGFGKIGDGRINDGEDQEGAPLAAYCVGHDIAMYDIDDTGHGTLVFTAAAADISAGLSKAVASDARVQIAEGGGDSLWALPSNEIALVGPDLREPQSKTYTFVAPGDRCG